MKRCAALLLLALLTACVDRPEPTAPRDVAPAAPVLQRAASGSLIDLGTLSTSNQGNNFSEAYGINNLGQVVGWTAHDFRYRPPGQDSAYSYTEGHAFIWTQADGMKLLPLPADPRAVTRAHAINDAGVVVGDATFYCGHPNPYGEQRAVVWRNGGMIDLGILGRSGDCGSGSSAAMNVNSSGEVTGWSSTASGYAHAFRWTEGGGMEDLGTVAPDVQSWAYDLNDHSAIVGYSNNAFLWTPATGIRSLFPPEYPPYMRHNADGINNLGEIVGNNNVFRSAQGLITYLHGPGGMYYTTLPKEINDRGQIVGSMYVGNNVEHAAYWPGPPTPVDLGTLGGPSSVARDINEHGQIVGASTIPNPYDPNYMVYHAFFTQVSGPVNRAPVPRPGGPYRVGVGQPLTLDGSASSDPDGQVLTYAWEAGDHQAPPDSAATPTHTYQYQGTYTVKLTVTDTRGAATMDSTRVEVVDAGVLADANGPYTGNEGAAIAFSSAGSLDPGGGTLSYAWSFGDGKSSAAANPSYRYADNGAYNVRLIVRNGAGQADTAATTATVANVAPTGTFTVSATRISSTAAGAEDESAEGKEAASAEEGALATTTPSRKMAEGTPYTLKLAGTDAGTKDRPTLQYSLDCGQGAGFGPWSKTNTLDCPAIPNQKSAFSIRARVRDKDGAEALYAINLTVTNAAPAVQLAATTATTIPAGGSLGVSGLFTDKGVNDAPWTYTIHWGDGTPATTGSTSAQNTAIPASHAFARAGTFFVQMSVKDRDGATGKSARVAVTITP